MLFRSSGGMKGCLCNFIRYIFVGLDTSGINTIIDFNGFATSLQAAVFQLLGESVESYTSDYFVKSFYFTPYLSIQNSALGILGLFAFSTSLCSQIGDLAISTIKRDLGLKHSGGFFLNYGGILDRVDAFIFSAPAAFYATIFISTYL